MRIVFVVGRVLFVLFFIFAGLQRLMNFTASADFFARQFAIPLALSGVAAQLESIVGLSTPQVLAMLAGIIELAAGLLLAFNVGTRAMAIVLILVTAVSVYYGDIAWTNVDWQHDHLLNELMLRIALIGGLLMFVALGPAQPGEPERPADV